MTHQEFNAHSALAVAAAIMRPNSYRVTFTKFRRYSTSTIIHAPSIGEATEQAQQFLSPGETLTVEVAT